MFSEALGPAVLKVWSPDDSWLSNSSSGLKYRLLDFKSDLLDHIDWRGVQLTRFGLKPFAIEREKCDSHECAGKIAPGKGYVVLNIVD